MYKPLLLLGLLITSSLVIQNTAGDGSTTSSTKVRDAVTIDPLQNITRIHLNRPMDNQTRIEGERLQMDCEISGFPTPIYTWFKDGVILHNNERKYSIKDSEWGNRLKINNLELSDSGLYVCLAENYKGRLNTTSHIRVRAGIRTTASQTSQLVNPVIRSDEAEVTDPFCQDYKGSYCNFLKTRQIYVTSRVDQARAEQKVIEIVSELTKINVKVDSACFKKSIEATCYFQMPVCVPQEKKVPQALKLCRRECEALYHLCLADFGDDASKWGLLPACLNLDNSPSCLMIGLTRTNENSSADPRRSGDDGAQSNFLQIILPVILAVILVAGVILATVCICRRRKLSSGTRSIPSSTGSQAKSLEMSNVSERVAVYVKEVSYENINMLQELGSGCFGKIFHGQAFGLYGNNTASSVFIKCLDVTGTPEQKADFHEELNSMSDIRHQHLLTLIGVSTKGANNCLLYEYLPFGDLRQFLLSRQASGTSLTAREVMYIVTQIASGLEYLSLLNFVHQDIAAHNVIVGQNLNVKLSTLKIVYGVHSANYYPLHNKQLPVRWLPPEAITYNKYSCETDIYSYGVFLWECFSAALIPYNGFTNQEVIEMVRSRQLLSCPSGCPPRIYSLMMECWHETPSKRPSAKEVHQKLRAWYLDNSYAVSTSGGASAPSGSISTIPSNHSSNGPPPSYPVNDLQNSMPKPAYMQLQAANTENIPYYNKLEPYKVESPDSCSSFDETSDFTDSTLNYKPINLLNGNSRETNGYTSTPNQRYASLGRKQSDKELGPQAMPLFDKTQMDHV